MRTRRPGIRTAHDPADGELIDLVDRYAHEKAWIVNYSNPAAIVAEGAAAAAKCAGAEHLRYACRRDAQYGGDSGVDRRRLEVIISA